MAMVSPRTARPILLLTFSAAIIMAFAGPVFADEPQWREPWQRVLVDWLKQLDADDVATSWQPIDPEQFDGSELQRNWLMLRGGHPPLKMVKEAVNLPAELFLWDGGIWRDEKPADQPDLSPYGLKNGQMWVPAYPTVACHLAWAHSWDRPWNPMHDDPAVARRAAIIAISDLIMQRENVFYYCSGKTQRSTAFKHPHPGINGFSLTFNAHTASVVADVLPEEVRAAWFEGLRWFGLRIAAARPMGPENMQLSVPVGLHYASLATGDEELAAESRRWIDMILDRSYDEAGYIRDGGIPDGSYNGISLHRLAEYYAITRSPRVLEAIRQSYELKRHLTLPEPGGGWLSPSHFNARSQDGFTNDQYKGREVMFALDAPASRPFLIEAWATGLTLDTLRAHLRMTNDRTFSRFPGPKRWGGRMHNWGSVLTLPYVIHHQDESKLWQLVEQGPGVAVTDEQHFARQFGGEFFVVRRPGYAVILYAGPARADDRGATNYRNMLKGEGGYFNGFAGGGISAFWTPEAGSLLLGRMTAYEAYERQTMEFEWGKYLLPGWSDWLNNHLVGKTADGKILTSARAASPESRFDPEAGVLTIRGVMPSRTHRQGRITDATVAYERRYEFKNDRVDVRVRVMVDQPVEFEAFYEILPLLSPTDLNISAASDAGVA